MGVFSTVILNTYFRSGKGSRSHVGLERGTLAKNRKKHLPLLSIFFICRQVLYGKARKEIYTNRHKDKHIERFLLRIILEVKVK